MIFWESRHKGPLVVRTARVECIYLEKIPGEKKNTPLGVSQSLTKTGGSAFINYFSLIGKKSVVIYSMGWKNSSTPEERIKIVDEYCDLDKLPKSVAVRTSNLDFIRELFARGIKVSWVEPDLLKFSDQLSKFKFKHLFINPFVRDKLILPTGEVVKAGYDKRPHDKGAFYIKSRKARTGTTKLIGFNAKSLNEHVDWLYMHRFCKRMPGSEGTRTEIPLTNLLTYFNILSITYMIWQQSLVMNVKRKTVRKE